MKAIQAGANGRGGTGRYNQHGSERWPCPSICLRPSEAIARNKPSEVANVTREFHVVVEKDEDGWYVASVPALRGCHTQAKSLDTLMKRVREAIELCLEVEEPARNEFVGVQRVTVKA
jgi:predicted RNase H-like HicB family nuclease